MRKTKIIMIDGFKPEYLQHAPYLNSLTKKSQWGELEMPPGHWGGVEILFKGKSDILAVFYRSENSSLKFVEYLSWLEKFGNLGRFVVDGIINFIRLIKRRELFRTGKIPLNRLYKFDIAIKKHFANSKDVEYIYFPELDELGHKCGTKSPEMIEAIKKIDKKISKLDFDLIFSDHGMADITKKISVPITKDCFIDGDMARYWGDKKELEKVKKQLPLKNGKILNWKNKKYGQLIFLANTGKLIFPNFWEITPSKAMHGYDGKHKDMKAIYILNKKGKKKNMKVDELYKVLTKWKIIN